MILWRVTTQIKSPVSLLRRLFGFFFVAESDPISILRLVDDILKILVLPESEVLQIRVQLPQN